MGRTPEQLIRDARSGNEDALLQLFDEHHLPLFRFAWRRTGSTADAEDIVQECFLTVLNPNCGFDPKRTAIRTYLFGAVRNQSLKRLRHRQDVAWQTANDHTPEKEVLRSEVAEAVASAIAQLPDTQREILLLAHYEQMSLAEIAEITQLEITAVKSRLQRARASLRETLAAYAPRTERTIL
jgi:RNA polymerase sigma-70 factor (ECF subfamily)